MVTWKSPNCLFEWLLCQDCTSLMIVPPLSEKDPWPRKKCHAWLTDLRSHRHSSSSTSRNGS